MVNLEQLEAEMMAGENVPVTVELSRSQWALLACLAREASRNGQVGMNQRVWLAEAAAAIVRGNEFEAETRRLLAQANG